MRRFYMRRISVAIPVLITGVCLYFAVMFGREAITIFTSPIWGLENAAFARTVHYFGRLADLGPDGLIRIAAFLGALKLSVAVVFVLHLAERFHPFRGNKIDHELLDAGALLVVCSTFIMAMPVLVEASPQLLAPYRPALWLAGLAATLSMIQRIAESDEFKRSLVAAPAVVALPPRRRQVSALRWEYLRREAGGA